MDGNAATVFERADFMAPKPDGLGLAEDDKDLDAIMQFIEELKKCEAKKSSAIAAKGAVSSGGTAAVAAKEETTGQ